MCQVNFFCLNSLFAEQKDFSKRDYAPRRKADNRHDIVYIVDIGNIASDAYDFTTLSQR